MKRTITLFLLFIGSVTFAQNTSNGGEYMDYFTVESEILQKDMWDYTKSVSHGRSARKVEKRRMELIKSSDAALKRAESAKGFNGNTEYRDAVAEYFRIINIVLKEDYAKIVDMEAVAEQSYDAMEAYMLARELANDKQTEAGKMLDDAQKKFAEANDITLIESSDELDRKMEIAGEVYDHYNAVYLVFFKSFKQEIYLLDAVAKGDMSGIEQNREALKGTIEEGKEKLKGISSYKGDRAMIIATNELFKFYSQEANETTDLAVDYFLKTENFNKIHEAFEQKKPKNRTQEDVDQYNEAVNEMNQAIEEYNSANESNNKERSKLIDGWNSTADKFTNMHVPRGK